MTLPYEATPPSIESLKLGDIVYHGDFNLGYMCSYSIVDIGESKVKISNGDVKFWVSASDIRKHKEEETTIHTLAWSNQTEKSECYVQGEKVSLKAIIVSTKPYKNSFGELCVDLKLDSGEVIDEVPTYYFE